MKRLLILFVLFTTSFYGQNETLKSYSYSYAYSLKEGWREAIKLETKIEIKLDEDKIIFSSPESNFVLSNIRLKKNFTDGNGFKGTSYFCQDKNGTKLEFIIMHETAKKNTKMVYLSYDKYLIAYDLHPSKNGK